MKRALTLAVMVVLALGGVAQAGGLGAGGKFGRFITSTIRDQLPKEKLPYCLTEDKNGKTKWAYVSPAKVLGQINAAQRPDQLADLIKMLKTCRNPRPLDLIALAERKLGRVQRPWWQQWFSAPSVLPLPWTTLAVPAAGAMLLQRMRTLVVH